MWNGFTRTRVATAVCALLMVSSVAKPALGDEQYFGYVRDTDMLPEGESELEQWVTLSSGKREGDYSAWDLRTEVEYGFTPTLSGAFYLNYESVSQSGTRDEEDVSESEFKGVSVELIKQILNPNLDPVGLGLYGEATTDGDNHELEGKLLLSKWVAENWLLAANAIYEAEFEREDGHTEKEAELTFTSGASYRFLPKWSAGLEVRNESAYPDGLNLSGQEFNTWWVGPNLHYGTAKGWATFTVLPQVWGNGDGASGGRQLVHEEEIEFRLRAGIFF